MDAVFPTHSPVTAVDLWRAAKGRLAVLRTFVSPTPLCLVERIVRDAEDLGVPGDQVPARRAAAGR